MVVAVVGSLASFTMSAPRVYYAMARDGLFVPAAAHVHPRWRTPVAAIAAQGLWSVVLVLSGTFSQLVSYTGFAIVLFAVFCGIFFIVATGFGKGVSFEHVFPTIVDK